MSAAVVSTRQELESILASATPGLVPTMGALHDGHLALIRRAVAENSATVVSDFVNPTQFHDPGDLARYPRDLTRDAALAASTGVDIVFAPSHETIYPAGFDTTVEVGDLSRRWEGERRPGHFRGVATVVAILLGLVRPGRAYFGEKDYQQLQIIRQMHRDLALPGEIIGCPTVRDADGLALSSRNARLSRADRSLALAIPASMAAVANAVASGERDVARLEEVGRGVLASPGVAIDYLAIVDGATLDPLTILTPGARLLVAAEVGGVRLIDNVALEPPELARQR